MEKQKTVFVNYEGVLFNQTHWKGKKEAEFLKNESHHNLSEAQLKEAFAIINKPPADSGKETVEQPK